MNRGNVNPGRDPALLIELVNPGRDPALLIELGDSATLALMTATDRADIMHRAWSVPVPLGLVVLADRLTGFGHWTRED